MSRIGKKIINIPEMVNVSINDNFIEVKGPKGQLSRKFHADLLFQQEEKTILIQRKNEKLFTKKIHGTSRALLFNMIHGVSQGFQKKLEIHGIGYKAQLQQEKLHLQLGFSHPVILDIPQNISITIEKNTNIIVAGFDKQLVGEFAATIRKQKKPEPYKGKGIRYSDEYIIRKAGKSAK